MSITAAIRDMLAKGLSIEQALEATDLIEKREEARRVRKKAKEEKAAAALAAEVAATKADRRAKNAARSRRYRERSVTSRHVTSRDITLVTRDERDASADLVEPVAIIEEVPSRSSRVTSVTRLDAAPPKKERVPPTPPLQEKTPPLLSLSLADARLVNETVDDGLAIEKPKKDTEALKAFGEEWNRLAAALSLPSIDEIKPGSTRERQALARLREMPPDGVQQLMVRIRGSPYLRGEVNGFRVSFDWIIKPSNHQKIMEGNYENRKITSFRR